MNIVFTGERYFNFLDLVNESGVLCKQKGVYMNCVNLSEAARIAGVSRQRLTNMRRDSETGKCPYAFFVVDIDTSKKFVDVDNGDWKHYVEKNVDNPNKKKVQEVQTAPVVSVDESDISTRISSFVNICITSAKEIYKANDETNKQFIKRIKEEYIKLND